jgi:predicted double-glycine peptidase
MKKLVLMLIPLLVIAKIHIIDKDFEIEKPIKSWVEFKNDNLVRQKYDYSCGSASLATIMHHFYNQNMSEKSILNDVLKMKGLEKKNREDLEDDKTISLSFFELSQYVKSKGFKAVGLALDLESLKKLKAPVILFVKIRKNEHFTVFKGIDKNYVYLADPSFGNTKIRVSKFKEMFYQRDDLKHPGKLLAILPLQKDITLNNKFMEIEKSSDFVYNVINMNNIKN